MKAEKESAEEAKSAKVSVWVAKAEDMPAEEA